MEGANDSIVLVGAGPMAVAYAKVLNDMKRDFIVVGRGNESAEAFMKESGVRPRTGGVESWLKERRELCSKAIIAVTENELGNVALKMLSEPFQSILVEKPGGANYAQIREVAKVAKEGNTEVYVAYNRRFDASTTKAKNIIEEDGGVTSFHFEFTEWSHIVGTLKKAEGVLENWFVQNSSHVVDLAFFLGGKPKDWVAFTSGGLPWHPAASVFSGAGVAENGALFSYQANWEAPGRWWVEMLTRKHRLILKPLEDLFIQEIGSVAVNKVELDDRLDRDFKAGLYKEVESFLRDDKKDLCTMEEQANNVEYYQKMCPVQ